MWRHFDLIGGSLADALVWRAQIAALPNMDRAGVERLFAQISRLRAPKTEALQSVYEQASDVERRRLIGSALDSAGLDWLKTHPTQAAWMAANGVSAADCLREFREYYASQMKLADGFFTPARNSRKSSQ